MNVLFTFFRYRSFYSNFQSIIVLMISRLKYFALIYNRYLNTEIFIYIKSVNETNRYLYKMLRILNILFVSFSLFQCSWYRISRNDVSIYLIANIIIHVLKHDFESKFEKRFHLFFCVLIINEHRMHAQRFAKKNVFSSYEMTRYFRIFHILIILSLRFKKWTF